MALLSAVLLAGCGGTPEPLTPDLPAPGTMVTLSVQPLAPPAPTEPAEPNLLKGGDFQSWWAGAPAPQGLSAPDPAFSRLERVQAGVLFELPHVARDFAALRSDPSLVIPVYHDAGADAFRALDRAQLERVVETTLAA